MDLGYSWLTAVERLCWQIGSFFMINLCLVVIATQFSETKKREMEKMLAERRRLRQQHSSSSTLASSSDLQPGDCYDELLKYAEHLARKSRRHLRRLARRRRRRRQRARDTDAAGGAEVVVCGRGGGRVEEEARPLSVSVSGERPADGDDEARRLSQQSCGSVSLTSAPRRPSSLQIDSSSSGSLRASPAFASVVSLRASSPLADGSVPPDVPPPPPPADTPAPVHYLVLPLEVLGDPQRSPSLTPAPSPAPVPSPAPSLPGRSRSTSNGGSVQFADTVKTCGVHRTASVGRARAPRQLAPQSVLVRKASILSTGANDDDDDDDDDDRQRATSALIKSSSFNGARRSNTEKCFRFSPETKVGRQVCSQTTVTACRNFLGLM